MEKFQESEFFKWQDEFGEYKEKQGEQKGIEKGKKEIIISLLKTMQPNEIAEKTGISISEINKIAEQ